MIRKIALVGATGMLGQPVARQLVIAGFEITALVRNPEKAKQMLPAGARLIKGDLRDASAVEQLLKDQDALYINLAVNQAEKKSDWHAEDEGLAVLLNVAKRAALQRVLMISSLVQRYQGMNNFHWWVFEMKERAIEQVKKAGIPYTIFYPSTFMESFLGKYRKGSRILLAGKSKYPMYYIAGDDYGKQVANSLQLAGSHEFVIQGPKALTQEEATAIFLSNYTREKLSVSTLPLSVLQWIGRLSATANYGAHIVEAMTKYPEKFESDEVWKVLGMPTTTLEEYSKNL